MSLAMDRKAHISSVGARNDHISQGHAVLLTTEHFVENLMWTRCWGCGEKYDGAPANGERVVKRSEQSVRPDIIRHVCSIVSDALRLHGL